MWASCADVFNLAPGKRLRDAKQNDQQVTRTYKKGATRRVPAPKHIATGSDNAFELGYQGNVGLGPHLVRTSSRSLSRSFPASDCSSAYQNPDLSYELRPSMTVIGALYINGEILGLSCCTVVPAKSEPAPPDVPWSLQPTPLQLSVIHMPGVDRFPFPEWRDNIINQHCMIDAEEFTRDICIMPSFTIDPRLPPWDPKAWKIEKYFANKWGWLFGLN